MGQVCSILRQIITLLFKALNHFVAFTKVEHRQPLAKKENNHNLLTMVFKFITGFSHASLSMRKL